VIGAITGAEATLESRSPAPQFSRAPSRSQATRRCLGHSGDRCNHGSRKCRSSPLGSPTPLRSRHPLQSGQFHAGHSGSHRRNLCLLRSRQQRQLIDLGQPTMGGAIYTLILCVGLSVERLAHRRRVHPQLRPVGRSPPNRSLTYAPSSLTDHGAYTCKHRRCSVGIQFITVAFIQCDSTLRFEHRDNVSTVSSRTPSGGHRTRT
jgi:hypothetical protein